VARSTPRSSTARVAELAWFAVVVAVVLGVGLAVGILVAPALTRWTERANADDEEPRAGDR
jgi:hypothetical protein